MIYIDSVQTIDPDHPTAPKCFLGNRHVHMIADTEDELRTYARQIGLRASWIQYPGTWKVHFDLTGRYIDKVLRDVEDGKARQITSREMALMWRSRRENANSQSQHQVAQS